MFHKGNMVYQDNKEIFEYKQEFPMWDKRVMDHHPRGTEYFDTYGDLRWHSDYKWDKSTMLIFDTRRWHSSNWFTKAKTVKENKGEYKESLVGFGSIDVPRNLT